MLASTLSICELRVNSRRAESMSSFVSAHASIVQFPLRAESDIPRAVDGADLVITVTDARQPFIAAGMLKPGAVVCSMGGGNELDYAVLCESERLIVDDPDFASEVGDGGAWIAQGHLSRASFAAQIDAPTFDVVAGKKPGRINPADRIIAIVQGMATGDVAFAAYALSEAAEHGRGKVVELP
jgi:ornithine cyclodeaminase/alanine dehydrogenase-like protein (mu-crystallin family)